MVIEFQPLAKGQGDLSQEELQHLEEIAREIRCGPDEPETSHSVIFNTMKKVTKTPKPYRKTVSRPTST